MSDNNNATPLDSAAKFMVSLKNGDQIDARLARALVEHFQYFLHSRRAHFEALRDAANGSAVPPGSVAEDLRAAGMLTLENELRDDVRGVFVSSFEPDQRYGGPKFVDPLVPVTKEEDDNLKNAEDAEQQAQAQVARDLDILPPDKAKPYSR